MNKYRGEKAANGLIDHSQKAHKVLSQHISNVERQVLQSLRYLLEEDDMLNSNVL